MKRFIALVVLSTIMLTGQRTQADFVIAGWTFETSVPDDNPGPHTAELGINADTSFASTNTGGTISNPAGNGSAESFNSNGWNAGEYFQFSFNTTGYTGISLSFDQTRSATGPDSFQVQYSTDGVNYQDFGAFYTVGAVTWNSGTSNSASTYPVDFGGLLDNVASARIRLTSLVDGSSSAGSNRVDNVFITAVPEPSAMLLLGMCLAPLALSRRRTAKAV